MADDTSDSDWAAPALRIGFVVAAFGLIAWLRTSGGLPPSVTAETHRMGGQYDQAIAEFSAIIKGNPSSSVAYNGRGASYREKGDLDHAFADLDQAIALNPEYFDAYLNRCLAFRQKGDADRALADCEQAARLKPDEKEPHEVLGKLLLARGDFERAADELGNAIRVEPAKAESRFYRSQIALFHLDRPADAWQDFDTALKEAFGYRTMAPLLGSQRVDGRDVTDLMSYRHPFVPDGYYLVVWRHIAAVRTGRDDRLELSDAVDELASPFRRQALLSIPADGHDPDVRGLALRVWPGAFIALYLGKLTPWSVRAAAQATSDPEIRRRRICDVDFYLAQYSIEKGAPDEARTLLQAAADNCPVSARESGFAKAELKRLGS
jgi:tetratricopeptide (TPR) repeat protein